MPTMFFKSVPNSNPKVPRKCFGFDSSPARAIGQALGAGMYDEKSYESRLLSTRNGTSVYEVKMRMLDLESNPGPHPLKVVGEITHTPSYQR